MLEDVPLMVEEYFQASSYDYVLKGKAYVFEKKKEGSKGVLQISPEPIKSETLKIVES
jgi:uncharacterized protein (UPF0303 family)